LTRNGFAAFFVEEASGDCHDTFSAFWMISSAIVFHSLHELHWPCHLEYWAPQFWQKKVVFVLVN
jgi:hypothetical protein